MDQLIIKPIPVPRSGPVKRLKLNIAPGEADVFIEQTQWPRQKQNPNWRIEVTQIDGRYDASTHRQIREACEAVARLYVQKWLAREAPLLSLDTVSWGELVRLATQKPSPVPSPYQSRRKRRARRLASQADVDPQIDLPLTTAQTDDEEEAHEELCVTEATP